MTGWDVPESRLAMFRGEVLRWNRRINLVSRREPELRVRELARECREAFAALPDALAAVAPDLSAGLTGRGIPSGSRPRGLVYVDIGSGAGFPGIVWWLGLSGLHPEAGGREDPSRCCLYEPRGKRAWFLEHVARELDLPGVAVLTDRWGGSGACLATPGRDEGTIWLVSLKAVKMTEGEVLAGWQSAAGRPGLLGGESLIVARFHPGPEEGGRRAGWPRARRTSALYGPARDPIGTLMLSVYRG